MLGLPDSGAGRITNRRATAGSALGTAAKLERIHGGASARRWVGQCLTSNAYIVRSTDIATRMFGGETMIMSPRDSTLFNLNEAASAIWEAADGLTPLQQIVEQHVCAAFDVSPEEAMKDAESFVQALAEHGILTVSEEAIQ